MKIFLSPFKHILNNLMSFSCTPVSVLVPTTLIAFLYIFAEWIFIFTKPSFLQTIPFTDKLIALVTASSLLVLTCGLILFPILAAGKILRQRVPKAMLCLLAAALPAFLLTSLALILVDNFTYTVFHFGIITSTGYTRALYAALYLFLGIYLLIRLSSFRGLLAGFFARRSRFQRVILLLAIFGFALAGLVLPIKPGAMAYLQRTDKAAGTNREKFPDILLITVDGVNADYTSLYGAERDTTPFLRSLASESLVAQNSFSNGQGTIASITSILTGRHSADTRVLNVTDILLGDDAYKHLPGILADRGYYTAQFSNAVYADAYKINFLYGFDEANGRKAEAEPLMKALSAFYPGATRVFIQEVADRLVDRLQHIFFVEDMSNLYEQVTEAPKKFEDEQKLKHVFDLLEDKRQPLFIHLHWLGTHGPNYYPDEQVFSAGLNVEDQERDKQLFYYDSILEFDRAVERIYAYLEENNRLDRTLLVVTSDHSQRWTNSRIPLLLYFPDKKYTGVIDYNVQSLDIAPTILDYLNEPQPDWMTGQSLIDEGYISDPIFTAKIPKSQRDKITGKVVYPKSKPPFNQFGRMSVIVCNKWYELDLNQLTLTRGTVESYPGQCSQRISETHALELLRSHLESYGFDTSTLAQVPIH